MRITKLETDSQLRVVFDNMVYTCAMPSNATYGDVAHSFEDFCGEMSLRALSIAVTLAQVLGEGQRHAHRH